MIKKLLLAKPDDRQTRRSPSGGVDLVSLSVLRSANVETTRALLDEGFPIGMALHMACIYGRLNCAQELMHAGADVNLRLWILDSPSARCPLSPLDLMCLHISHEDVMAMPIFECFQLDKGMLGSTEDRLSLIRQLIKKGADVHPRLGFPHSPMIFAAHSTMVSVLEILQENGAKVNAPACGVTPLMAVTGIVAPFGARPGNDRQETIRWLLDHDADPDVTDLHGRTALWRVCAALLKALERRDVELCQLLYLDQCLRFANLLFDLDHHSSILNDPELFWHSTKNSFYEFALELLRRGEPDLAYTPAERGDLSCLHNVLAVSFAGIVHDARLKLLNALIERGVDVNRGHPILKAIGQRNWPSVERLLRNGAIIPFEYSKPLRRLLLNVGYARPMGSLIRLVIHSLGRTYPDMSLQAWLDEGLLHACVVPHPDTIAALLDAGADVNVGGPTCTMVSTPAETPLGVLLNHAHQCEERYPVDDGTYPSITINQLFETFRLLCDRGAVIVAPTSQIPTKSSASVVEDLTRVWPKSGFRDEVQSRCDFVLSKEHSSHSRLVIVGFHDYEPDKVDEAWHGAVERLQAGSYGSQQDGVSIWRADADLFDSDGGRHDWEEEEDEAGHPCCPTVISSSVANSDSDTETM
ncbi:uncharacterized protein B0I36DRAFT_369931 [Microdochium trichocladiopsis]|uniref:Ankyrin repeat-containing domain protein n=1 Tax=Microdochium trichocladiopsis TaxID=1682393 RepID=A0A9P9BIF7_9PEZI|nr:uncharacterized protein B0I36DRAFT_369931 [Microdochium trichocladiopsis]KAH7012107.1 hypothetical protein B0I36DRAFT_369931 [Microdochium trichocladiopsis]